MNTAIIKPEWSFLTIAMMVLGFMFWWPVGLAVLAYIAWGEYFGGSADRAERWVHKQKKWARDRRGHHENRGLGGFGNSTGNAAFDDYREEQLKRLDEERRKLDEDVREFHEYMRNLHKARDREEFDRFMRDRQSRSQDTRNPDDNARQDGSRQGF